MRGKGGGQGKGKKKKKKKIYLKNRMGYRHPWKCRWELEGNVTHHAEVALTRLHGNTGRGARHRNGERQLN